MQRAVISLQLLLLGCQFSERRRNDLNKISGKCVPKDDQAGSFPPDQHSQLATEQDYVKEGLGSVEVEIGKTGCPLVGVVCQSLVRIGNTVVEVAYLVVMHVLKVQLVEVFSKLFSKTQGQLLCVVVDC